eukprot:g3369.t1
MTEQEGKGCFVFDELACLATYAYYTRPAPAAPEAPACDVAHPDLPEADEGLRQRWIQRQDELLAQLREDDATSTWYFPDLGDDGEAAVKCAGGGGGGGGKCEEDLPAGGAAGGCRRPLQLVGGVDISFVKGNSVDACASLVVLSYPEQKVVYEDYARVALTQPYMPGFLAFREVGFLVTLVNELRKRAPECEPDVIMVDGNGVLHKRGFGLACHLGVLVGIPTVGVGKNWYEVDGLTKEKLAVLQTQAAEEAAAAAAAAAAGLAAGASSSPPSLPAAPVAAGGPPPPPAPSRLPQRTDFDLLGDSGRVWGKGVFSTAQVSSPIFISVGHRVSLATAVGLARRCSQFRVPEPVRQADIRSRTYVVDLDALAPLRTVSAADP